MSSSSISPLDGRYASKTQELQHCFSEAALITFRLKIEVEWLLYLCNTCKLEGTRVIDNDKAMALRAVYGDSNEDFVEAVKEIEKTTNHDVKAVEYYLKQQLDVLDLSDLKEFVHFACTSEDINNLSYALMIKTAGLEVISPAMHELISVLHDLSREHKAVPMLSRTHGQPASPSTMGKELLNVVVRLQRQYQQLDDNKVMGKINGAVGNFNAHVSAYPDLDWQEMSRAFVEDMLGLKHQAYTTQIEPHDYMAEIFHNMMRFNTILIDLSRDIWMYISYGFFKQKLKEGEVGSSTMPHKVNPIDFENGEGNLGLANAVFGHLAEKLPISRMQRDLSDSTVQRNIGVGFAYSLLAYKSVLKGLGKLEINEAKLAADLDANWEVLAEPIQTVMRRYRIEGAYEKLKEFSRGKRVSAESVKEFIAGLDIPEDEKMRLSELSPATYTGVAEKMVDAFHLEI